jgi:hypothetical protein
MNPDYRLHLDDAGVRGGAIHVSFRPSLQAVRGRYAALLFACIRWNGAAPSSNTTLRTMESGSLVSTDLILTKSQISRLDPTMPLATAAAIGRSLFFAVGDYRGPIAGLRRASSISVGGESSQASTTATYTSLEVA